MGWRSIGLWAVLAGCKPKVCGEEIPITGDTSDPDVVAEIRSALRDFLAWTGEEVCLEKIQIDDRLFRDSLGVANRNRIGVVPYPSRGETLTEVVWHELCHVIDLQQGSALSDDPAFAEGAFVPGRFHLPRPFFNEKDRQSERLAQWCELGPLDPSLVSLEETCGHLTPALMMERVWKNAPIPDLGEVRLTTAPEEEPIQLAYLGGRFRPGGDRLLRGQRPEDHPSLTTWIFLDEALMPISELKAASGAQVVAASDDRVWLRPAEGGPTVMLTAEGTLSTQLPDEPWVGGFSGGRLWLWNADAPGEIIEALPDGTLLGRHPLPEPYGKRYLFPDSDRPTLRVWSEDSHRLVSLPDGEILAELPLIMLPERRVGEGITGTFAYALGGEKSTDAFAGDMVYRSGQMWLDASGEVHASLLFGDPDCAAEPELLPGKMEALVPGVDGDRLMAVTRRWSVD